MIKIRDKWAAMIDLNNVCSHGCIYCIKHVRHLRPDQHVQMTPDEVVKAIESLDGFQGKIGLTGGEPLNSPYFVEICAIVKAMIPKPKAMMFTSNKPKYEKWKDLIDEVFGEVYTNWHDDSQKEVCLHQPLLLAVGDVVEDKSIQQSLIEKCWCNIMWSPIIGKKGAFFCDCALGIDLILDVEGGWPVEYGWWKKEDYSDQMGRYCHLCGMCVPYPRQRLMEGKEKISRGLYEKFRQHNLKNLDNMEVFDGTISVDDLALFSMTWEPWHNRQDRSYGEGPAYVNPC